MSLFQFFLVIHIVSGTVGLLAGTINIVRKKGDKLHLTVGKFFFFGMMAVSVSAFVLSVMHMNYFLFIVGVFTLYLVGTGQRYLSLKQIAFGQKPILVDWVLSIGMLLFGIAFIVLGITHIIQGTNFGIVLVVFGGIGFKMSLGDFKNYKGKSKVANIWLLTHIQRMTAGYIAAFTAFLVVNNKILPGIIAWLLPTIVLTPLIIYWSFKYKKNKENLPT